MMKNTMGSMSSLLGSGLDKGGMVPTTPPPAAKMMKGKKPAAKKMPGTMPTPKGPKGPKM